MKILKKEPYPQYPSEWDDPQQTVYREFRLAGSDFGVLYRLVEKYMHTGGNEGIKRHRLLHILRDCDSMHLFLAHQKRKYPRTWKLRLVFRKVSRTVHRRLQTRKFRNEVYLCQIAREVVQEMEKK